MGSQPFQCITVAVCPTKSKWSTCPSVRPDKTTEVFGKNVRVISNMNCFIYEYFCFTSVEHNNDIITVSIANLKKSNAISQINL